MQLHTWIRICCGSLTLGVVDDICCSQPRIRFSCFVIGCLFVYARPPPMLMRMISHSFALPTLKRAPYPRCRGHYEFNWCLPSPMFALHTYWYQSFNSGSIEVDHLFCFLRSHVCLHWLRRAGITTASSFRNLGIKKPAGNTLRLIVQSTTPHSQGSSW